MSTITEPHNNYPINFREAELQEIFHHITHGESCAMVGVNGVGKTHLLHHLYRPEVQAHHLAKLQNVPSDTLDNNQLISPNTLIMLPINLYEAASFTADDVLSLILLQLREVIAKNRRFANLENRIDSELAAIKPEDAVLQMLITALNIVYENLPSTLSRIVLVLDASDGLYSDHQSALFRNFRALRDRFHYRLSYIVPMRQRPVQILASVENNQTLLPFIDLIKRNEVFLKPYSGADYEIALASLKKRLHAGAWIYSDRTATSLGRITGGHARFLRTLVAVPYLNTIEELGENAALVQLLADENVISEIDSLYNSLTESEKIVLDAVSKGKTYETNALDLKIANNLKSLHHKGLLHMGERGKRRLAIPLLERYIRRND